MQQLVSVIIPNYNNSQFLEECIHSVYRQTYRHIEVIVVDDGSTDNSLECLEKIQADYPDLILVKKGNGGPSSARNTGLELSRGQYLAFLDSDDFWNAEKLLAQVNFLEEKGVDMVFSNYQEFRDGNYYSHTEKIIENLNELNPFMFYGNNPLVGSASNVIIRRKVYESVGNWDSYLRAGEDSDYWFRCIIAGFKVEYLSQIHVFVRSHGLNARFNYARMFHYQYISIDKWHQILIEYQYDINSREYKQALRIKLSKLRWYCNQTERPDFALLTFLTGTYYHRFSYFDKLTTFQLFKATCKYFKFIFLNKWQKN